MLYRSVAVMSVVAGLSACQPMSNPPKVPGTPVSSGFHRIAVWHAPSRQASKPSGAAGTAKSGAQPQRAKTALAAQTFSREELVTTDSSTSATALAMGDLDGDGDDDLVAVYGGQVRWFPQDRGVFLDAIFINHLLADGYGIAIADMDADEDLDIVIQHNGDGEAPSLVWLGNPLKERQRRGAAPGTATLVDVCQWPVFQFAEMKDGRPPAKDNSWNATITKAAPNGTNPMATDLAIVPRGEGTVPGVLVSWVPEETVTYFYRDVTDPRTTPVTSHWNRNDALLDKNEDIWPTRFPVVADPSTPRTFYVGYKDGLSRIEVDIKHNTLKSDRVFDKGDVRAVATNGNKIAVITHQASLGNITERVWIGGAGADFAQVGVDRTGVKWAGRVALANVDDDAAADLIVATPSGLAFYTGPDFDLPPTTIHSSQGKVFDMLVTDIDKDGDQDIIIASTEGIHHYTNKAAHPSSYGTPRQQPPGQFWRQFNVDLGGAKLIADAGKGTVRPGAKQLDNKRGYAQVIRFPSALNECELVVDSIQLPVKVDWLPRAGVIIIKARLLTKVPQGWQEGRAAKELTWPTWEFSSRGPARCNDGKKCSPDSPCADGTPCPNDQPCRYGPPCDDGQFQPKHWRRQYKAACNSKACYDAAQFLRYCGKQPEKSGKRSPEDECYLNIPHLSEATANALTVDNGLLGCGIFGAGRSSLNTKHPFQPYAGWCELKPAEKLTGSDVHHPAGDDAKLVVRPFRDYVLWLPPVQREREAHVTFYAHRSNKPTPNQAMPLYQTNWTSLTLSGNHNAGPPDMVQMDERLLLQIKVRRKHDNPPEQQGTHPAPDGLSAATITSPMRTPR